ncbi:hypothetical protein PF005_g22989 [Phytophthora fragariae]|uniref:Uncharacterized protein n=1 Tax=Phytophthora fragariae TaxID=53985 RepID=A0A6A3IUP9_9STRA|nr:hypothetical protein PF003_g2798 [Phytophthora fragariae]KAE8928354.1 hypothetical protein PF009_g21502 [Phytophthora fragariae]KAE8983854.1 hypothetical protein PF011_g21014 [Phytophthora fragariae]KAE9082411.1 hypothetical protein PF010_g21599 [Phytophthora fragariae]KAE9086629.1 hypothetical protein PF007_g20701 [Phytophthora fragariae]
MGALQLERAWQPAGPLDVIPCSPDSSAGQDPRVDYVNGPVQCWTGPDPASDGVHQTGTRYSSNNAGDGPEKTRDRKSWFPRFKSNWLGTFRSKQMFHCCECAVAPPANGSSLSSQAGRYKGAEGKHCRCGKDQWHLAKSVEETEYNRRMEISKALGGMRYDEAVLRLRSMGQSELDFKPSEQMVNTGSPTQPRSTRGFAPSSSSSIGHDNPPKRARSASSGPLPSAASRPYATPQLMKPDLSTLPTMSSQMYGYENPAKQYGGYTPAYDNNGIEYAQPQHPGEYEQLTQAPFGDEEGFGELLQGILEDDPRVAASAGMTLSPNQPNAYGARYGYYAGTPANGSGAPLKRTMSMPSYAMTSSMMTSPPREGVGQDYYADPTRRASLNLGENQAPFNGNYHHPAPHQQHQHQQLPVMQQFPYQQQQQESQQQVYSRPLSNMATATSNSFST